MTSSKSRVAAAVLLAASLACMPLAASAQKNTDKAAKLYEDALVRYEKNDIGGAIVQLKNALQIDPKLLAAHVLLGTASLANGDPAEAETAFTRALELGADRAEVAVPMAQALFDQGKYAAVLERFPHDALPAAKKREMLVLRGLSQKGLGDTKAAMASFTEARALDPTFVPALIAQAELLAQQGRRAEASKLADEATALAPSDPRGWNFKAQVAWVSGDSKTALDSFSKALALAPGYGDARIGRASLLMDLGRLDEAEPDVAELEKRRAVDPRAAYIRAVYFSKRGNEAAARVALEDVTRLIDATSKESLRARAPEMLLLGGVAHFSLAQLQKARTYLQEYLRIEERHAGARKILGSIYLTEGDPRTALSVLEPALKRTPNDPDLLVLVASAHMARGQHQMAASFLEQALKASGGAPDVHATMGLSLLGSGQRQLGIEHLQRAFEKDPGQPRAGVALAVTYLKQGRPKDAVRVAEAVTKREPDSPALWNLLGAARLADGDRGSARKAYESAVRIDRRFLPARLNLARLDAAEGNVAGARERLTGVLKDAPRNTQAMLDLARLEARAGRTDEAIRWLEKARAVEPRNVAVAEALVDLYLGTKLPDKALEVAKQAEAGAPEDLGALSALGRAYLAVGNEKMAQGVFSRMSRLASADADKLAQVAALQLAANDRAGAAYTLEKALAARPDHFLALSLAAESELRGGDLAKAEARAKLIATRNPASPVGHRLLGDVAFARKNYGDAISAYTAAFEREKNSQGAVRLYQAYAWSGNLTKANTFMEGWVKAQPEDGVAMRALAEGYLRAGDFPASRRWYEEVLKRAGDDPVVLNNLANILGRQNDPKALEYAERAHRLAPKDGTIQDTLGWTLVQRGQVDAGLRHLREARIREPSNPEIRYHLAYALAKAGRRDEAKQELEPAIKEKSDFFGAADARRLWTELSGS